MKKTTFNNNGIECEIEFLNFGGAASLYVYVDSPLTAEVECWGCLVKWLMPILQKFVKHPTVVRAAGAKILVWRHRGIINSHLVHLSGVDEVASNKSDQLGESTDSFSA